MQSIIGLTFYGVQNNKITLFNRVTKMKFQRIIMTLFILSFMLSFGSVHAATAFFANGGLTANGIEWCEENYPLYNFMGNGFFEHHKQSIEPRICVSLYNDPLWTYSEYDRYEKLAEQSRIYAELEINESAEESVSGIIDVKPAVIEEIPQKIEQQQKELEERSLQQTELVCGMGTVEQDGQCVIEPNKEEGTLVDDVIIDEGGGCLIATATYGTELAPQVQQLRELRDNTLLNTESGTSFMNSFNQIYYSFSPHIADYERENPIFKETVKIAIAPLISSLSILNYVEMSSDQEVLGYGISLIMLNIGMYFAVPIIGIVAIRNRL